MFKFKLVAQNFNVQNWLVLSDIALYTEQWMNSLPQRIVPKLP